MAQGYRGATAAAAGRRLAASRQEWPFVSLCLLALLSPFIVLGQGGDWPLALLSLGAVMAVPGAAIEAMMAVARLALWVEGGGS
jgi:hypothetical protein